MSTAILIVEQSSELGGAQLGLLDLLPALSREFSPRVAVPGPGPLTERLQRAGIPWSTWPLGNYTGGDKPVAEIWRFARRFPAAAGELTRQVREAGAQLLVANGPRAFPATATAARRCRIPCVWHLQVELIFARDRQLCAAAARLARPLVLACSQACLTVFPPHSALRRNAHVLYPGVRLPGPGSLVPGPWSPLAVGVIGRLHPDKGQDLLLRAAAALPGVRIRFFGEGDEAYERQLRQLADALPGRVEFCGWVDDVAAALAGLQALVVPSRREALARVILEAFAARVPVAAAATGGIPEVITHERNGLLFAPDDASALAATLGRLLADPALRLRLVDQAYRDYEARWRLERFQQEMVERLSRCVS